MAKQVIQVGTVADDGTGDPLRTAFTKTNANFTELYTAVGTIPTNLNSLTDTVVTSPSSGQVLKYNGTNWVNSTDTAAADLGNFKIQDNFLGTTAENNGWGGSDIYVSPNGEGYSYVYIPNDTSSTNGSTLTIGNGASTGGGIQLSVNNGSWTFNNGGTVLFPTIQTNLHNGGNQNAQTLQFSDPAQQVVITGPTPTGNDSAQRLIIQGQRGAGTGEGGDVYFWGGDADNGGGDIKIYAGDADSQTEGYGGYVNINGGRGFTQGGEVNIEGGSSWGGQGSDVNIRAGSGIDATSNGVVNVRSGNHTWQFNNAGSLQLPTDGTIKDANGNILISSSTFIDLPNWLTAIAGTNHLPSINSDYGWDSNGVWFTNATIGGAPDEGTSYPVRLVDPIPANQGVVITVEFDANPFSNDFGIGVWETGDAPVWDWGPATGGNRIGAQYDGTTPVLKARTGTGVDDEGRYNLPSTGSYKARLTISAPDGDDEITVTLETLDLSDTVLDTISYVDSKFTTSYLIGFAADQDGGTDKTYMKNLTVNINGGDIILTDELTSYNSVGTTGTGHFSFADNTVTLTGDDMRFRTTRDGFDIDCDFDVEAADDVWIEALGDTVGITAANNVTVTTSSSNMHPDVWQGEEGDFIGEWDGTTLFIHVPSNATTLISLLDHYVNSDGPIWIRTASGYVETDNPEPASKSVIDNMTHYEIPVYATSPTANASIISMKLYDSINGSSTYDFEFTKAGALRFPSGGKIEGVGMGWMGVTNGTEGTPVSMVAKNPAGDWRAGVTAYNNSGVAGEVEINTVSNPGTPSGVSNWDGGGGWNQGSYTNLATTGGTGTGLTVDVAAGGSGYIDISAITIANPGSGYTNSDVITITNENDISGTFTIAVNEISNSWTFTETGKTTLPGGIVGRVKPNSYTDTTIELDVTATINKITPVTLFAQHYHLADGVEGQIMYVTLATGGDTTNEYTILGFDHARYHNNAGYITEASDVGGWMPFRGVATTLTLLFIDGHWNLPHAQFD